MSKLLLLEDEIEIGETLLQVLKREGYEADWAKTGDEAVAHALNEDYDLMILDVMLKRGTISNGMDVARIVSQHKSIPYIMLTSRSDSFDIMLALDMGAEDYITKPYDLSVLLARIRAALRRTGAAKMSDNTLVSHNELTLNLSNHQVLIDDKPIPLSNQLFQLLHFFVQNKRKILSREELYRNVWGYDLGNGTETNTLEVNIKRLRQQIGSSRIKTVRGKGYMLE